MVASRAGPYAQGRMYYIMENLVGNNIMNAKHEIYFYFFSWGYYFFSAGFFAFKKNNLSMRLEAPNRLQIQAI